LKVRRLLLLFLASAAGAPGLHAQSDVELLGMMYGTRPPDAYYRRLRTDPDAFQFSRAWTPRLQRVLLARAAEAQREGVDPMAVLGQREGVVSGEFHFPLVLGLFGDSPETPPYDVSEVQREFFDGPNSRYRTIPQFYDEMSGGRVQLVGATHDWQRVLLTAAQVAAQSSGLGSRSRVGDFIVDILSQVDASGVDWGPFDNDGPDGLPNSGDDDGYVDILAVMHPLRGAECDGNQSSDRIWSHRWTLGGWGYSEGFVTSTPSANAAREFVTVWDYTIQPVLSCRGDAINEIGVFAHELGHGFGLPDLYGTGGGFPRHGGVGYWDLMATGAWGCQSGNPERPCHLGAWGKAVLGWVQVEELARDTDHTVLRLGPVEREETVYRVDGGDDSGEYFLLENRQAIGFDQNLFSSGLLIWHVDPAIVEQRWGPNTINADPLRMGVAIRQADGLEELGQGGPDERGDDGDPFPGSTGNDVFHAGSNPASFSNTGSAMGVTFLDIAEAGTDSEFRLLTRYQEVRLLTEGTVGDDGLFSIDGAASPGQDVVVASAPFQRHVLEASPGEPLEEGTRNGFIRWEDGSPRVRDFQTELKDSVLTATYGQLQHRLLVHLDSEVPDIEPGAVAYAPPSEDGWYAKSTSVNVTAQARTGFSFREWSGAVAGPQNPVDVVLDTPKELTASFDLVYGFSYAPSSVTIEAAAVQEIIFVVENANPPVSWALEGALPQGLELAEDAGKIAGAAMETGAFSITVTARDAIGLEASVLVALQVVSPVIGVEQLTGPFLLTGAAPTVLQRDYLDRFGNQNGIYDLGDFRAFLVANPGLPMTAAQEQRVRTLVPMGSMRARREP
jgi:M6 family metalloprotease-like protein